jgi:hypothetical protein
VLGPYLDIIDAWLLADQDAPRKQRHTAHRVHTRLVEEYGFSGRESTVRHYVRQAKVRLGLNSQAVFIPLEPDVGREAEVDWGTATAVLSGERVRRICGNPFRKLRNRGTITNSSEGPPDELVNGYPTISSLKKRRLHGVFF